MFCYKTTYNEVGTFPPNKLRLKFQYNFNEIRKDKLFSYLSLVYDDVSYRAEILLPSSNMTSHRFISKIKASKSV